MNKAELITAIIDLYDRAEAYERILESRTLTVCDEQSSDELSSIDRMVLRVGRLHIVDSTLGYWKDVDVSKDEETGIVEVQSYESWVNGKLRNVPEWISKRDFVDYFHAELFDVYTEEKEEAIERLLDKEAENEDR